MVFRFSFPGPLVLRKGKDVPELSEFSYSLEKTLKDSDLQNITTGLAEALLESLIEDGIAKDIPIIGTIVGLGKVALGIKERLFLKKIIYFISELRNIPSSKRKQMVDNIDSSGEFSTRVGEKLLHIIDKCEDHEKSQIVARLFAAFIDQKLSYKEFLRSSSIVERTMLEDLSWFIDSDWERLEIHEAGDIINSGLVVLEPLELSVEDQWDHKASDKYIVNGGEFTAYISDIGKKIRSILKS